MPRVSGNSKQFKNLMLFKNFISNYNCLNVIFHKTAQTPPSIKPSPSLLMLAEK